MRYVLLQYEKTKRELLDFDRMIAALNNAYAGNEFPQLETVGGRENKVLIADCVTHSSACYIFEVLTETSKLHRIVYESACS